MEFIKENHKYVAKTFIGLEGVLAAELEAIGATDVKSISRSVLFSGDKKMLYKANMFTRTSLRILAHLFEVHARSEDDLYKATYRHPWEELFAVTNTFAVDCVVKSDRFKDTRFVTLKIKDAIIDRFRHQTGRRPNVEVERPDYRLNVHIWDDAVTFYIDSTCEPLFKRGYRFDTHTSPLNEVLAAGLVKLSGWNGRETFLDPMCGSGTVLAEATMIATNSVPGLFRTFYGFKNWSNFEYNTYKALLNEAKNQVVEPKCKIIGADVSRKNISVAKRNIENMGFQSFVDFKVVAFEKSTAVDTKGTLIINPPHDEEIETIDLTLVHENIGKTLEKEYTGWNAWVISPSQFLTNKIGLNKTTAIRMYNGSDDCLFTKFDV